MAGIEPAHVLLHTLGVLLRRACSLHDDLRRLRRGVDTLGTLGSLG